jgi:hypothetical protein
MERADGKAAGDDGFIPARGSKLTTCNNWDGSRKPVNACPLILCEWAFSRQGLIQPNQSQMG